MMQMKENSSTVENTDAIYAIFRLYNLGRDNMVLRAFVGRLGETWTKREVEI
jgi:hypothetical protein